MIGRRESLFPKRDTKHFNGGCLSIGYRFFVFSILATVIGVKQSGQIERAFVVPPSGGNLHRFRLNVVLRACERKVVMMCAVMRSEKKKAILEVIWRWLRSKVVLCVMGCMVLVLWCLYTPINKPPGTHIQIQLDRKYRPVGSATISQKSRNESWIVRGERGWLGSRGMISFLPQLIQLRCDSPFNATLIDLSGISGKELIALNTHPERATRWCHSQTAGRLSGAGEVRGSGTSRLATKPLANELGELPVPIGGRMSHRSECDC